MVNLGDKVTDSITGFKGVAIGKTEWLYRCIRFCVAAEEMKDGKPIEDQWFDEQRLTAESTAKVGGPHDDPVQQVGR